MSQRASTGGHRQADRRVGRGRGKVGRDLGLFVCLQRWPKCVRSCEIERAHTIELLSLPVECRRNRTSSGRVRRRRRIIGGIAFKRR